MNDSDNPTGAPTDEVTVITGEIQFYWDSGDDERHLLVNIEPEHPGIPDAYELVGALRDAVIAEIAEQRTIEISYIVEHHEIVDPDGATTLDGSRPRILSARILPDPAS